MFVLISSVYGWIQVRHGFFLGLGVGELKSWAGSEGLEENMYGLTIIVPLGLCRLVFYIYIRQYPWN